MAVDGVSSRFGYLGLPSPRDMAAVLAARPSIAEVAVKARAKAVAVAAANTAPSGSVTVAPDLTNDATDDPQSSGASVMPGKVDMYL